jgi:hypothetical protein
MIGDEGAIRIAEGLEMNTSLKELYLRRVFPPHSFFIQCPTPLLSLVTVSYLM